MPERVLTRRLSALDASFLYIETPEAPLHLGGIEVFDGPLSRDALIDRLEARIDEIPRYRQRVVEAPWGLGHPFWEDAPSFDLREHVRETTLPSPGDQAGLKACAARIFEVRLARDRPLWELHLVHGLKGGRTAIVSKIHHAMVDGISGVELLDVLFDLTPEGSASTPLPRVRTFGLSSDTERLLEVAWDAVADVIEYGTAAAGLLASWWRSPSEAKGGPGWPALRVLARAAVEPVARLPFNQALTGARRISWAVLSFAEIRQVRAARGGTLNDVVLAVLADAVGRWLRGMGEATAGRHLRILVPVNLRREDEAGQLGNRVSLVPVEVPFDALPLDRHRAVVSRTEQVKSARVAEAVSLLTTAGGLVPAPLYARALAVSAMPPVLTWTAPLRAWPPLTANLVCTNVPGPQVPLYAQGRRLLEHYPIVPLAFELGLGVAVFSYDQRVFIGLLADAGIIDDLEPLVGHLDDAFSELRTVAGVPPLAPVDLSRVPRHGEAHAHAATSSEASPPKPASAAPQRAATASPASRPPSRARRRR